MGNKSVEVACCSRPFRTWTAATGKIVATWCCLLEVHVKLRMFVCVCAMAGQQHWVASHVRCKPPRLSSCWLWPHPHRFLLVLACSHHAVMTALCSPMYLGRWHSVSRLDLSRHSLPLSLRNLCHLLSPNMQVWTHEGFCVPTANSFQFFECF